MNQKILKSKIGLIYIATFPNGKSYIGKTVNFNKRKREHISIAFNKSIKNKSYNHAFSRAIRKYGLKNIKWKILHNNVPIRHIFELEVFYIYLFSTYREGYNMTTGGDNPPSQLGKRNPKVSQNNSLRIGEKHPFYKTNVADKIRANYWKIITPDGRIFKIKNLSKFCRENNLQQGLMWAVSRGKRNHHKGYDCKKIKEN